MRPRLADLLHMHHIQLITTPQIPHLTTHFCIEWRTIGDHVGHAVLAVNFYNFRLRIIGPLMLVPQAQVRHFSGKSSTPSAALSRFKGYHWARSRVYVGRKHGVPLPWLNGMKNALWHLIRPRSWWSAELRAEARGRLAGVWSMIDRNRPTV